MSFFSHQVFSGNQVSGNARAHFGDNHYYGKSEEEKKAKRREEFLKALFCTDPEDDLTAAKFRARDGRTPGTCKWLPETSEYIAWHDGIGSQLLLLVGEPGIGKTMMATFLIDTLKEEAQASSSELIWFFCENTKAKQKTVLSILRGLLWQITKGNDKICDLVQEEFSHKGQTLFEDFEALWRFLELAMIERESRGGLTLLIDALDECEEQSRDDLVARMSRFLGQQRSSDHTKSRILVTTRNVRDVIDGFRARVLGILQIQMDVGKVNKDLEVFIDQEVNAMSTQWKDKSLADRVKESLRARDGGTFLWVSFALVAMSKADPDEVLLELDRFPYELSKIYGRILSQIPARDQRNASNALKLLIGSDESLTLDQIAVMLHLISEFGEEQPRLPTAIQIGEARDWYKSCAVLLRCGDESPVPSISFIHQSVKDFLIGNQLPDDLEQYHVAEEESRRLIRSCAGAFISSKEVQAINQDFTRIWLMGQYSCEQGPSLREMAIGTIVRPKDLLACIRSQWAWDAVQDSQLVLLHYVRKYMSDNNLRSNTRSIMYKLSGVHFGQLCLKAAEQDLPAIARVFQIWFLPIRCDGALPIRYDGSGSMIQKVYEMLPSIRIAAERQNRKMLEALVAPAVFFRSEQGLFAAVELLGQLEPAHRDMLFEVARSTTTNRKRTILHRATWCRLLWIVERCIEMGDDCLALDHRGRTALHYAVSIAQMDCLEGVFLLLRADSSALYVQDDNGRTPLHYVVSNEYMGDPVYDEATPFYLTRHLLAVGGSELLYIADSQGRLPLHQAVKSKYAQSRLVSLLLQPEGAHRTLDITDKLGMLPLHHACKNAYVSRSMLGVLLDSDVDHKTIYEPDHNGKIPLHHLAYQDRPEEMEYLLAFDSTKVTLHAADNQGQLPIHIAAQRNTYYKYRENRDKCILILLEADIASEGVKTTLYTADSRGRLPIHHAVDGPMACSETVKIIVGADSGLSTVTNTLYTPDDQGRLPIHYAAMCLHQGPSWGLELTRILVEADAQKRTLTVRDSFGNTPLELVEKDFKEHDWASDERETCREKIKYLKEQIRVAEKKPRETWHLPSLQYLIGISPHSSG